jgi:arylsulfatase A-like enzyme
MKPICLAFLGLSALGLSALGLSALGLSALACAPSAPPRGVVVVVVDTLRADHLGAYGYPRPTSPRIDAFAADAVRFADATSPAPWTLPSLATLMTSLYPSVHGAHSPSDLKDMTWYFQPREFRAFAALHDSRITLAEILRDAGFSTWGAVQGSYPTGAFGMSQGFETYRENATPGIRFDIEDAFAWLDAERPERFLVYLHAMEVHAPYTPIEIRRGAHRKLDPEAMAYYRAAVAEERLRFLQWDFDPGYAGPADGSRSYLRASASRGTRLRARDVRHLVALYDRGIAYVDHWVGALIEGLRQRGLYDETIVVLTSDHGEEFFEHGRLEHSFSYYEEMLKVPLILRVPGEGQGVVVEETVGLVDVLPSLLDWLEVSEPDGLQGRSLRSLLVEAPASGAEYVGEASFRKGDLALRGPGWKYIRSGGGQEELYDLVADPSEATNLCAQQSSDCAQHRSRLAERVAENRSRADLLAEPEPARIDATTLQQLEALGYVD